MDWTYSALKSLYDSKIVSIDKVLIQEPGWLGRLLLVGI